MPLINPSCEVRRSRVLDARGRPAGCGLFASPAGEGLRRGDFIGFYSGEFFDGAYSGGSGFALAAGEESFVLPPADADGGVNLAVHRLAAVNEPGPGSAANAVFYEESRARDVVPHLGPKVPIVAVGLWAASDIPAGEEVLALYGKDYDRSYSIGARAPRLLKKMRETPMAAMSRWGVAQVPADSFAMLVA